MGEHKRRGSFSILLEIRIKENYRTVAKEKIFIDEFQKLMDFLNYVEEVYGFEITKAVLKNLERRKKWFEEDLFKGIK